MDFGGNSGLFLGVTLTFISGLQFAILWCWGRAERGVNDGYGVCD